MRRAEFISNIAEAPVVSKPSLAEQILAAHQKAHADSMAITANDESNWLGLTTPPITRRVLRPLTPAVPLMRDLRPPVFRAEF